MTTGLPTSAAMERLGSLVFTLLRSRLGPSGMYILR